MKRSGYSRCQVDRCYYLEIFSSSNIILRLNVYIMLIVVSDTLKINKHKMNLCREFNMVNQGATNLMKVLSTVISADEYTKVITTKKLNLCLASTVLQGF